MDERIKVLKELKKAADLFIKYEYAAELIPEIRTNIAYALPDARTVNDVAAIPGRITQAFGKAFYCMEPAFGASDHMARLVLSAMKYDKTLRSAMNVKLFEVEGAYRFDRSKEPEESREKEGGTMGFIISTAVKETGSVPRIIMDMGDWGKEPGIYVLGSDPAEVVKTTIELYERFKKTKR